MTDLGRRPASDLIGLLADGEVSSREIVGDFVSRYELFNPAISAIIEIDADAALKAATESDLRRKAGESLGPLDGLPITVKDNIHVRGLGARWGSRLFADHRPEVDDIAIERLRRRRQSARENEYARVCPCSAHRQPVARADPQSLASRPHTGRVQRGRRGGAGGWYRPIGDWH